MAQQTRKRRRKDRARETFMLLMLSVVLVFAFGLVIGKQESANLQQTEAVPVADAVPPEEAPVQEATVPPAPAETTPPKQVQLHQATNLWSIQPHVYLRIDHQKQLEIGFNPDAVSLSQALYSVSDERIASVDEFGMIKGISKGECIVTVICNEEVLQIPVTVRELKIKNGCTYVDDVLVANKNISLPKDYDPGMLPETAEAFQNLRTAAEAEGLNIYEGSGYRNYQYQIYCYNSLVENYGEEYADRISAKPGHSEHQTGYTVDCNSINQEFIDTPEGQWLDQHCYEFGFIIRYPKGKEDITGYDYECWHIRYVGVQMAWEIHELGLTLEEYLDVVDYEHHVDEEEDAKNSSSESESESETETDEAYDDDEDEYNNYDEDNQIMDAPLEAP